jgi:hypothetical protein
VLVALEVFEQRRAPRSLLTQPLELVLARVRVVEDPFRVAIERVNVARPGFAKRRTVTPITRSDPSTYSFFQVM